MPFWVTAESMTQERFVAFAERNRTAFSAWKALSTPEIQVCVQNGLFPFSTDIGPQYAHIGLKRRLSIFYVHSPIICRHWHMLWIRHCTWVRPCMYACLSVRLNTYTDRRYGLVDDLPDWSASELLSTDTHTVWLLICQSIARPSKKKLKVWTPL